MKIPFSVSTCIFADLSPEACVDAMAAAGFAYGELGFEHGLMLLERQGDAFRLGSDFCSYAADRGVCFPQGHLDLNLDMCRDTDRFKVWLDLFHGIGIKAAVIHANGATDLCYEAQLETRAKALRELVSHVEGTGITICVENLFANPMVRTADTLLELLDAAGQTGLGVCLDIGHLHRTASHGLTDQTSREFIEKCGSKLKALHVHDNMGVNDDHLFPFCKNGLDWKMFMTALLESGYDGLFNMELPGESHGSLAVRQLRMAYAHELVEYLFSETFLNP